MIIPVVGMHRSGTSALAGVLHHCGVMMGEPRNLRPQPAPQNPKGFYEDVRFRKLNDALLSRAGYEVKSWGTAIPEANAPARHRLRMRRLIKGNSGRYAKWGFKDPRTCLTLGMWLDQISSLGLQDDCRIVYIARHPASVAASLASRGNAAPNEGLRLWLAYNTRALAAIDAHRAPAIYLTYEHLMSDPEEALRPLANALGITTSAQFITSFLDRDLQHHEAALASLPNQAQLRHDVLSLFAEIDRRTAACRGA